MIDKFMQGLSEVNPVVLVLVLSCGVWLITREIIKGKKQRGTF